MTNTPPQKHVQLYRFSVCMLSYVQLFVTPSTEFPRQEYWSGLPLPTPGELPNLGNEPAYLASPILAGGFFTAEPLEKSNSTSDILTAKSDYCNATWSTIP